MNEINKTSFSKEIKEEITLNELSKDTAISLLSAYLKNNGYYGYSNGQERIEVATENAKVIKFIYFLLKKIFPDIQISFAYRKSMRFNKSYQYLVNIFSNITELLSLLELDFLSSKIPTKLVNTEDKLKGYFMGLFLASGSCSNPESSNYHFEFSSKDEEYANNILKLTKKIKVYPFTFKIIQRRNSYVIYLKKSEQIASFLAFIDSTNSSLLYESYRLERDMLNISNRQENLDYYNYKKTIRKSEELIKLIDKIDKKIGLKNITNRKLKELCYIRKEFPDASYQDLANLLGERLNTSITKSNVAHLITSIKDLAIKLNIRD